MKKINITSILVQAEVSADLVRMFEEKNNLGVDSPYGKMDDKEFAENRKQYSDANIGGWFGWDSSYMAIIAARVANKIGYNTSASHITSFLTLEQKEEIKKTIKETCDLFCDLIIAK